MIKYVFFNLHNYSLTYSNYSKFYTIYFINQNKGKPYYFELKDGLVFLFNSFFISLHCLIFENGNKTLRNSIRNI